MSHHATPGPRPPLTGRTQLHLATARLSVRDLSEADAAAVLQRSRQAALLRYLRWDRAGWAEPERVENWLEEQKGRFLGAVGLYKDFAIDLGGHNVGGVALQRLSTAHKSAELAWELDPGYWGRGYATEAVAAFLDYAFHALGLHRVRAVCDSRNRASYRLMSRLGMRREACHRQVRRVQGTWIDEYIYAVLRKEWLGRPRPAYRVVRSALPWQPSWNPPGDPS